MCGGTCTCAAVRVHARRLLLDAAAKLVNVARFRSGAGALEERELVEALLRRRRGAAALAICRVLRLSETGTTCVDPGHQ